MAIPSRQIGWGTEENLLWEISKQLETLTRVISKIGQPTNTLPSNCIQFVVNTTTNVFFTFSASSLTQNYTYTVTWGDGATDSGSSGDGGISLSHTYAEPNTSYTARVCFSDASVINNLDFPGFD